MTKPGKADEEKRAAEDQTTDEAQELAKANWEPYPPVDLKGKQRSYLKQMAHHYKPVVQIGQEGVTERVIGEIRRQLLDHELVKIKWLGLSNEEGDKKARCNDLARRAGAHYIHMIGQTLILYRELEPRYASLRRMRRIKLPDR